MWSSNGARPHPVGFADFGLTSGCTRIVHAGYLFPEARDVLRPPCPGDSPPVPSDGTAARDGTAGPNRIAETLGPKKRRDLRTRATGCGSAYLVAIPSPPDAGNPGRHRHPSRNVVRAVQRRGNEGYRQVTGPSAKRRWLGHAGACARYLGDINDPRPCFRDMTNASRGIVDLPHDEPLAGGLCQSLSAVGKVQFNLPPVNHLTALRAIRGQRAESDSPIRWSSRMFSISASSFLSCPLAWWAATSARMPPPSGGSAPAAATASKRQNPKRNAGHQHCERPVHCPLHIARHARRAPAASRKR